MEFRSLDLTLISAKDLKDVNMFSKMDVYAVVSINGDPRTNSKTPIAKDCGTNPKWNYSMKFTVDESAAQQDRLTLVIKLVSDRTMGDKEIGEVHVPLKELLDRSGKTLNFVTYNVRMTNGKSKGSLEFSFKFGDKFTQTTAIAAPPAAALHKKTDEPVTAYPPAGYAAGSSAAAAQGYPAYPPPAGGAAASYAYPPPQYPPPAAGAYPPQYPPAAAGAYPPQYPPPQPGYGGYSYPPPGGAPGYGYQQGGYGNVQQPQKPKKNKMGMGGGLGLGLGAGLLGGLLVGDMVGDMDGMDGGGFDF
jgi:hypothetical protein